MCGGAFFAVPYLGLSIGLLPSLAIGASAFGAGELILSKTEKTKQEKLNIYEALNEAKNTNTKIQKVVSQVEDSELAKNISEIHVTVSKIIETVEKKPDSYKKMNNFFNYYLPVTINILTKYDEIEIQKLNTEDSKKFMESTQKMVKKINEAFKKQLSNLYQSDMIDTDAEMKVFDTMLKSDGYDVDDNDFKI